MKIVVIGGSGLIGKKVVTNLRQQGHEVVAASPSSGVNTVTGEGLAQAIAGAQVVVDVANAPSWEDNAVLAFFETSGRNLLGAESAACVGHHVALSVVRTDRAPDSGDLRPKLIHENLIRSRAFPIRSCARRSSSNSLAALRNPAKTVAAFADHMAVRVAASGSTSVWTACAWMLSPICSSGKGRAARICPRLTASSRICAATSTAGFATGC